MSATPSERARVALRPVDDRNRAAVLALSVRQDQINLIASNAQSLQQAAQEARLQPRVLLEGDRAVGFAMYAWRDDGSAYIWRVMIDAADQGRGLGKRLMELLLEELRSMGAETARISHRPQNQLAARLFESLGFAEVAVETDGEVIRELRLPAAGR